MASILIVEDDRIISTVVSAIVTKAGYKVVSVARTATDAVRLATVHNPDLVLMDIGLEGSGDGIEAAMHIADDLEVPIIFITGHTDLMTLERAQKVNPLGFLSKPIREADVINTISIALNRLAQQQADTVAHDNTTFNGRIDMLGGIASVLEMVKVIHSQCALHFGDGAALYVAEGKIVHAKLKDLAPQDAIKQLLTRNKGTFRLEPDSEPETGRSLSLDVTTVLLNLAKEADEAHKGVLDQANKAQDSVAQTNITQDTVRLDNANPDGTSRGSINPTGINPDNVKFDNVSLGNINKTNISQANTNQANTNQANTNQANTGLAHSHQDIPTELVPSQLTASPNLASAELPQTPKAPSSSDAHLAGFPFIGEVILSRNMGAPLIVGKGFVRLPEKRYLSEFKATLLPLSYQGCADDSQGRHHVDAQVRISDMTEGDEPLTLECQFSSTGLEVSVLDSPL
jgi:CheY-like chemotaxis protein